MVVMEDSRKRRLAVIGFILVVAVFITGFIYAVVSSSKQESYWNYFQQRVADSKTDQIEKKQPGTDVPILLYRDEVVRVGNIKLIYRGKKGNHIQIAVIIPALDPQAEYLHSVDADRSEGRLRLGGAYFRIVSSRTARLKLERVKQ